VVDPNEFAKTWVGEVQYNIPTEPRGQMIEMISMTVESINSTLNYMRNGDLNKVTDYESLRENMQAMRTMIEHL